MKFNWLFFIYFKSKIQILNNSEKYAWMWSAPGILRSFLPDLAGSGGRMDLCTVAATWPSLKPRTEPDSPSPTFDANIIFNIFYFTYFFSFSGLGIFWPGVWSHFFHIKMVFKKKVLCFFSLNVELPHSTCISVQCICHTWTLWLIPRSFAFSQTSGYCPMHFIVFTIENFLFRYLVLAVSCPTCLETPCVLCMIEQHVAASLTLRFFEVSFLSYKMSVFFFRDK